MLDKELLQQALDALENPALPVYTTLRKEIRMALSAPQPEPTVYRVTAPIMSGRWIEVDAAQYAEYLSHGWQGQKLYAAPPAAPAPAKRMPLESEALLDIYDVWVHQDGTNYAALMRMVEKAHDIRGGGK